MNFLVALRTVQATTTMFKDSSADNINMSSYNDVISNLKFISKVDKGEKINTNHMFVQQDNLLTSISRTFYNKDNRIKTFHFLKKTIERSFELIEGMIVRLESKRDESTRVNCTNMIADLKSAREGIENLKNTYITDIKFCCDMDTLVQEINAKLVNYGRSDKLLEDNDDPFG